MLKRVLIPIPPLGRPQASAGMGSPAASPSGAAAKVPLAQVADIKIVRGPTDIKSEEGELAAYVFVDFSGRDVDIAVDVYLQPKTLGLSCLKMENSTVTTHRSCK